MISRLDHLVLTVKDIETSLTFYTQVLGMEALTFGDNRRAVRFGEQKINFHEVGSELLPRASKPQAGSSDLCFITEKTIPEIIAHLKTHKVDILEGPVERTGARSKLLSVYFRDPDGNLIEVSSLLD